MNTTHKQVKISHEDWEEEVDEEIAPLILALWKKDIFTYMSCQENGEGTVWILFASFIGAEEFMNIVCDKYDEEPESLYQRISGNYSYDEDDGEWSFTPHVEDFSLSYKTNKDDTIEEVHKGKPDFNFSVSVRFPRSDLKEVCKKFGVKYKAPKVKKPVRNLNPKAN